jgi:hypothetical protein
MANWAYVQDNVVNEIRDFLPKTWRNISNLRASENDIEFLNNLNWYSVSKNYEPFDSSLYRENGYDYSFDGKKVIETIRLVEKEIEVEAVPEILDFETLKNLFMSDLRVERNNRLKDSDWSQLYDIQNSFDEISKNKWAVYRQELRDLPQQYEDTEIIDLNEVVWPNFNTSLIQE